MGAIPYAPHMIFPWLLDEQNGREKGIKMGLEMLLKCDALFYDSMNEITAGMEQEIMFARANDIPVLATFESIDRFKRGF